MSLGLKIVDHRHDHILITTDEPARFELSLIWAPGGGDRILVHGYRGANVDMEQDPVITYDGTEHADMQDMVR